MHLREHRNHLQFHAVAHAVGVGLRPANHAKVVFPIPRNPRATHGHSASLVQAKQLLRNRRRRGGAFFTIRLFPRAASVEERAVALHKLPLLAGQRQGGIGQEQVVRAAPDEYIAHQRIAPLPILQSGCQLIGREGLERPQQFVLHHLDRQLHLLGNHLDLPVRRRLRCAADPLPLVREQTCRDPRNKKGGDQQQCAI